MKRIYTITMKVEYDTDNCKLTTLNTDIKEEKSNEPDLPDIPKTRRRRLIPSGNITSKMHNSYMYYVNNHIDDSIMDFIKYGLDSKNIVPCIKATSIYALYIDYCREKKIGYNKNSEQFREYLFYLFKVKYLGDGYCYKDKEDEYYYNIHKPINVNIVSDKDI